MLLEQSVYLTYNNSRVILILSNSQERHQISINPSWENLLVSLSVAWVACIVTGGQSGHIPLPTWRLYLAPGNSCTFWSSTPAARVYDTRWIGRTTTDWLQERLSTIVELHPASLSYYQCNNTHFLSYWLHSIMHFSDRIDPRIDPHDQINQRYYFMT